MQYIPGNNLDSAWDGLSKAHRDTIFEELTSYISTLRSLKPPKPDLVSSALENPAYDCRIGSRFYGPMTQYEFHSLARGHLVMEDVAPFLGEEVAKVRTSTYRTHFTHADLAPRNIIVKDGYVAAIIDWAFAGWYPEYWEYTKANYLMFRGPEWGQYLDITFPNYSMGLIAERILWRRLPEAWDRVDFFSCGC